MAEKRPNESQAIKNLQRYLRKLSYEEDSIPAPPIDGVFASDTQNALRAFQTLNGLEATGIADQITWELLYTAYRSALSRTSPSRTVALFPREPDDYALSLGDEGIEVRVLQHMLSELSFDYSELDRLDVNGRFDAPTEAATLAFQRRHVLRETGKVDKATWNSIADLYNTRFTSYAEE